MKIVVFSDVHGNIEPLQKMIDLEKDTDLFISLGDIVNYGPYSNECVELIEALPNVIKIRGNHEEAFLSGHYNGTHEISNAFFNTVYPSFNKNDAIRDYVQDYQAFDFLFVHTIFDQYIYNDSDVLFDQNYMIGHSHRQYLIENGKYQIYNPGSIGQNRINIEKGQYLVYYPDSSEVEFKTIDYDFNKLIQEMKIRKYPSMCIDYYLSKYKV